MMKSINLIIIKIAKQPELRILEATLSSIKQIVLRQTGIINHILCVGCKEAKLKLSRLNTRGRNALACALLHVGVDECEGIGTHSDSTKTCQHTQCSSHTPPESTYRENAHVQLRQQLLGEKTKWWIELLLPFRNHQQMSTKVKVATEQLKSQFNWMRLQYNKFAYIFAKYWLAWWWSFTCYCCYLLPHFMVWNTVEFYEGACFHWCWWIWSKCF